MGGSRGGSWFLLFLALASVLVSVCGQNATQNSTVIPFSGNGTTNSTTNSTTSSTANSTIVYPYCAGVELIYELTSVEIITINASTPAKQPYRFVSTLSVNNGGYSTVDTWGVGLNWTNQEILVSATGTSGSLSLEDGNPFPYNVSSGCILEPSSPITLHNLIETAGDATQSDFSFTLTGTEFGNAVNPMPQSFNFTTTGYNCSVPKNYNSTVLRSCCLEPSSNITLTSDETFQPAEYGDFTITYDVVTAYSDHYKAQVTISDNSPTARLDHWALNWTWQNGEFIYTMQGARPKFADTQVCLNGIALKTYANAGLDVNTALSCSTSPEISDMPASEQNDTTLGNVKYCCRNGTILPAIVDPSKSKSAFTMDVYKVQPYNQDVLNVVPPVGFNLVNTSYKCGQPKRIAPSQFLDPYLDYSTSAQNTWQVSCNYSTIARPKCCVSFSTYLNDSIVPCPTYACGVLPNPNPNQCSANTSAMLLPYSALTLRPENRTAQILAWASILHTKVPTPLPCPDNCGVAINWHIVSDYTKGWSARMSLFDWSNLTYADWFAVVEMDQALPGYQSAYTFNGTLINSTLTPPTNSSLLLQGVTGYNDYLLANTESKTGVSVLQSVISFTKATTPGINVAQGGGFPSKVWFNGDECALPDTFPTSGAFRVTPTGFVAILSVLVGTLLFWL